MDSLDAGDADMRAAAEASLFETDADSDTSDGTASPTPQPAQLPTLSSNLEVPPDTPGRTSPVTEPGSQTPLPPPDSSHAFPSTLSPGPASPVAADPPLTPGTPSHRPRPRTRTRTRRQSRMHAHPSTTPEAMGSSSLRVNNNSAATALANLLAHSPTLAAVPSFATPAATKGETPVADEPRLDSAPAPSPSISAGSQATFTGAEPTSSVEDAGSAPSTSSTSLRNEPDEPPPTSPTTASTSPAAVLAQTDGPGPDGCNPTAEVEGEEERIPQLAARVSKHLTLQPSTGGEDHENWEFWGTAMIDYQKVAKEQPKELAKAIRTGIPPTLRGAMWQLMSGSKSEELERTYASYLDQSSTHDKAIKRDLLRTYPDQNYFRPGSRGQDELFNVVKAYALLDPEVGYCQGMQFIVGPLLLNMPDEEAFSCWVQLMRQYNLRGHFLPGMPTLQLRVYQFTRLLEDLLPRLHTHLVRQGVKPSMYASPWLMTLFCYRFPLEAAYRVLDAVFAEGIDSIFRFALLLMEKNEDTLLGLDFEGAVLFLKERVLDVYRIPADTDESPGDPAEEGEKDSQSDAAGLKTSSVFAITAFFADAAVMAERISAEQLDKYAGEHQTQLDQTSAPLQDLEALRQATWRLAAKVRELEQDAESQALAHVELMKQVVGATLARDEVAEQLVQYKTMYAEAVLARDRAAAGEDVPHWPTSSALDAAHMQTPSAAGSAGSASKATATATATATDKPTTPGVAHSVSATVASWGRWMSRGRSSVSVGKNAEATLQPDTPRIPEEPAHVAVAPEEDAARQDGTSDSAPSKEGDDEVKEDAIDGPAGESPELPAEEAGKQAKVEASSTSAPPAPSDASLPAQTASKPAVPNAALATTATGPQTDGP